MQARATFRRTASIELNPAAWPPVPRSLVPVRVISRVSIQQRAEAVADEVDVTGIAGAKLFIECPAQGNTSAQSDLLRLIHLAQHGEEVVITRDGRAVAKLTGIPAPPPAADHRAWLARLARLRESTATDKTTPTTEEILGDLRGNGGSGAAEPAKARRPTGGNAKTKRS